MKKLRALLLLSFLAIGGSVLGGCATMSTKDISATEEQNLEWDDMTIAQKIGYSLWWPFQIVLLAGGSALGGHGP